MPKTAKMFASQKRSSSPSSEEEERKKQRKKQMINYKSEDSDADDERDGDESVEVVKTYYRNRKHQEQETIEKLRRIEGRIGLVDIKQLLDEQAAMLSQVKSTRTMLADSELFIKLIKQVNKEFEEK